MLAHCPRCGSVISVEPIVQRVELVGGERQAWRGKLDPMGHPIQEIIGRSELMVSFESATVDHSCPNPSRDRDVPVDAPPCGTCGSSEPHTHDEDGGYVPLPRFWS